jgi:hypothetical protein
MKKTVLVFGLISGVISIAMMLGTLLFVDKLTFDNGLIFGYTALMLSGLVTFFGVRSYRDNVAGGRLGFGRGLVVGLLITLVSCVCYVAVWEVVYFKLMPDFGDKYAAHMVERVRASGATPERLEQARREAADFKTMYDKWWYNAALTFLEPLPVGVTISLISAAVLRKRRTDAAVELSDAHSR